MFLSTVWTHTCRWAYHTTNDIIKLIKSGQLKLRDKLVYVMALISLEHLWIFFLERLEQEKKWKTFLLWIFTLCVLLNSKARLLFRKAIKKVANGRWVSVIKKDFWDIAENQVSRYSSIFSKNYILWSECDEKQVSVHPALNLTDSYSWTNKSFRRENG